LNYSLRIFKRSADFYKRVLRFEDGYVSPEGDYHSVKQGKVLIGLGGVKGLEKGHYFLPEIELDRKGLGVEIVLEVEDVDKFFQDVSVSGYKDVEPLTSRPWGLKDFRVIDPDGYYLRITSHY
jgi:lactoylglutathione lyase